MAEPEIDEAAAVETAEAFLRFVKPTSEIGIVARAALAWKAERDTLRRTACLPDCLDVESAATAGAWYRKHAVNCPWPNREKVRAAEAHAEAAEAERDSTVREWNDLYLKLQNADKSRPPKVCAMGMLDALIADRDDAKERLRVMESRMKQIHAALLAAMSDEQLAQAVKAR